MKTLNKHFAFILLLLAFTVSSCGDDNEVIVPTEAGNMTIYFNNKLGNQDVSIKDLGDQNYQYTDEDGQSLNLSIFAYYISAIELEGPGGIKHIDPLNVSANAADVKGYYHVVSTKLNSNIINLTNVTPGQYNKIRFTVGVGEEGVQQGAAGGVLDPANGAWFWNWNAGYISFGLEGNASTSGQEYIDWGNGTETAEGSFSIHIGGWKDVTPAEGEDAKFVNNIKTIEIDLGFNVKVEEGLSPKTHIDVDFASLLQGNDFSTSYAVHRPDLGKPFAERLKDTFSLNHVHQ